MTNANSFPRFNDTRKQKLSQNDGFANKVFPSISTRREDAFRSTHDSNTHSIRLIVVFQMDFIHFEIFSNWRTALISARFPNNTFALKLIRIGANWQNFLKFIEKTSEINCNFVFVSSAFDYFRDCSEIVDLASFRMEKLWKIQYWNGIGLSRAAGKIEEEKRKKNDVASRKIPVGLDERWNSILNLINNL